MIWSAEKFNRAIQSVHYLPSVGRLHLIIYELGASYPKMTWGHLLDCSWRERFTHLITFLKHKDIVHSSFFQTSKWYKVVFVSQQIIFGQSQMGHYWHGESVQTLQDQSGPFCNVAIYNINFNYLQLAEFATADTAK